MTDSIPAFLTQLEDSWIQDPNVKIIIDAVIKILASILVIFIGWLVGLIIRKALKKFFQLTSKREDLSRKSETLSSLLRNISKYVIWFLVICQILTIFGVSATPLVALASVASVALGFGSQAIVKDFISGIFILVESQYNVGDVITINGFHGIVESVGIRTTKIRDANGDVHIIPNGSINIVTNRSKEYKRATINLDFPNAQPVDRILKILRDEMKSFGEFNGLVASPEVIGLIDLNATAFKVQISAECVPEECWPIEREIRYRIKRRFEKEEIA